MKENKNINAMSIQKRRIMLASTETFQTFLVRIDKIC